MKEEFSIKKRVAIYGRVSSEREAQLSAMENQILWYDREVERHPNWVVVDRYFDKGLTGTIAKKRPSFQRMISDSKRGLFDLIITREVSRFSRNTIDTLHYTRELKELGIEVLFLSENISTFDKDGETRLSLLAAFAQDESRKMSDRVKAGQYTARHEKGVLYGTGNILGYNRSGNSFVIDEEQAETVRMIFKLYLDGKGIRTIKQELIANNRKNSAYEVKWYESTISKILANPMYIGKQYQEQYYVSNYLKHQIKRNSKEDYVLIEGNFESIISEDDFERVQVIKSKRVIKFPGNKDYGQKPSNDRWLKYLECDCGSKFQQYKWRTNKTTGEVARGYTCRNRVINFNTNLRLKHNMSLEGVCDRKTISEWYLELMIKDLLTEIWDYRKESIMIAFQLIKESYVPDELNTIKESQELKNMIEKNKAKSERLLELYTEGLINKDEFTGKRNQIQEIILDTTKKIEMIEIGSDQISNSYELKLEKIKNTLEHLVDFNQEKIEDDILHQLLDKVIVRDDNEYEWYINLSNTNLIEVNHINPNDKYEKKRQHSIELRNEHYTKVFESIIDVDRAKEYRCKHGNHIKPSRWNDIKFHVYVR